MGRVRGSREAIESTLVVRGRRAVLGVDRDLFPTRDHAFTPRPRGLSNQPGSLGVDAARAPAGIEPRTATL